MSEHNSMVISWTLKVSQNDFRKLRVPIISRYLQYTHTHVLYCMRDIDIVHRYNILLILRIYYTITYRANDR